MEIVLNGRLAPGTSQRSPKTTDRICDSPQTVTTGNCAVLGVDEILARHNCRSGACKHERCPVEWNIPTVAKEHALPHLLLCLVQRAMLVAAV